jgi:hypothetical protein
MRHLLVSYGPPYYGMGSLSYQLLGGCALWPGWRGRVAICPTLFVGCSPLQPFADHGCAMAVVCLPVRGAATRPCCDPEEVILPLRGRGLWRFNAFRQLPCPLWWVLVGGPFRGQSGDRHGDFCGLLARARIHRSKGRHCLGRGHGPCVRGHPPEGGFEVLVVHNGHCIA